MATSSALPRIAVTAGEPAGIGPELVAMLAASDLAADLVAIGASDLIAAAARSRGITLQLEKYDGEPRGSRAAGHLRYIEVPLGAPVVAGKLDVRNAGHVIAMLTRAADGCQVGGLSRPSLASEGRSRPSMVSAALGLLPGALGLLPGEFDAVVTAPVQKSIIADSGVAFSGHTEFFARRAGCEVVMLLTTPGGGRLGGDLRVALATTHLPLSAVPAAITRAGLVQTLRILCDDLIGRFGIAAPRVAVLGLNPHAGEGGHLGHEEIDTIIPAIEQMRAAGFDLAGPLPADTAFLPAQLVRFDAVLAMYHDQGLPVLKHAGFGHGVNVTLGLPYVRTSVDHGTALDLAGTGRADASSMLAAAQLALDLAARQSAVDGASAR
jgi:4-hydroxythreonine-4-phosphate dehydrogenase